MDKLKYVRARELKADIGRWLTVDQLWPLETAFGYVQGTPQFAVDPSGLAASCQIPCPKHCPIKPREGGATYCCNGHPVSCTTPLAPPPIRRCIQAHEGIHMKRIKCTPMQGFDPGQPDPAGECLGYTAEFKCAISTNCGSDPKCARWKDFDICLAALQAADTYCGAASGVPLDPAISAFLAHNRERCAILVIKGYPR